MSNTQFMPFVFSDNETKRAHNVSAYDFLRFKNRYTLKPVFDDKERQVSYNGHLLYDLYKDDLKIKTRYILDGVSPDDESFFSAIDFLMEHEEYTPQAAITEVYLCIFGFPKDYLEKYGNKGNPESQFLTPIDLTYMTDAQVSDLRPRSVPAKDWENSTIDRKLSFVESVATEEEKDIISKRFNKKISTSMKLNDTSHFVAPNPMKYCKHIEDFLINTLKVSPEFVGWLVQKHLLYEDYGGNLIAPGYDKEGSTRFAYRRSCWLKSEARNIIDRTMDYSDMLYTWRYINAKADGLYLFEDILDAICYMDLMKTFSREHYEFNINEMELHSFMYIGHLTGEDIPEWILQAIQLHSTTKKLYVCFQNDYDKTPNHGQKAATSLVKFLDSKGYYVENILPDTFHTFTEFLAQYKANPDGKITS